MKKYTPIPATPEYNQEICELFALPMRGMISLSKERSPNFFSGASIQNSLPETYIYKDPENGELCAVYSIGKREVYINGEQQNIQYLSDLRIPPKYRGGVLSPLIWSDILESEQLGKLVQTAVLTDNANMIRSVEKINALGKEKELPYYHFVGKIVTCILPLPRRQKTPPPSDAYEIRFAKESDIQAMQTFFNQEAPKRQFYPHYEFNELKTNPYYSGIAIEDYVLVLKNNVIIGMSGVWNQDNIWRTKIVSYDKKIAMLRPLVNLYNRLKGGIHLPKAGSKLRNIYLHTTLIQDDNAAVFESILKYMLHTLPREKYDQVILGLSEFDPCVKALEVFKNKRIMGGNYYLISKYPELVEQFQGKNFYMEVARI